MSRSAVSEPPTPEGPVEADDHGTTLSGDLTDTVVAIGRGSGLHSVGVTSADIFEEARRHLFERRLQGLHAGMQFTYRNPDRSTDPSRILPGARSLVVAAWSYRRAEPLPCSTGTDVDPTAEQGQARPRGRVARYARADHYVSLRRALAPVVAHLRSQGWRATVVCDDNALVDRAAAQRAGLGWFGKNSLLLIPDAGSWFVLGSVVTDAPLRPTPPKADAPTAHAEGCGSCSRCMNSCPTGALVAPGVVDARRCLAWLVQAPGSFPDEFRVALGDRIYGCDECQQVCPINKVADRRDARTEPLTQGGGSGTGNDPGRSTSEAGSDDSWVDLLGLLEASDEELLAAHGRWYIAERNPRYLRRNALVALGNVGDGEHPGTEQALRRWVRADDALLAEHARWAARRLGCWHLVPEP